MTELYSSAGENEDRQWVKGCLHDDFFIKLKVFVLVQGLTSF